MELVVGTPTVMMTVEVQGTGTTSGQRGDVAHFCYNVDLCMCFSHLLLFHYIYVFNIILY